MGTQPPALTLLEIGDLSLDRFRGILRLGYQGDAWLEVRCRVQANPLSHNPNLLPSSTLPLSTPLLASQPLLVPMTLRLSKLHLRAILILVVSASKGITLVFKNDPLQNVDVSSTFDSVEVIRGYLQQEIEGQLREMFREDLPGIIHRLSQRWFTGSGVGGKVEMPYMDGPGITTLELQIRMPKNPFSLLTNLHHLCPSSLLNAGHSLSMPLGPVDFLQPCQNHLRHIPHSPG
jgi:distribution and morphology protein 34